MAFRSSIFFLVCGWRIGFLLLGDWWFNSLLFRLFFAAWTIYEEASFAATLIVAVVLDAAAVFVLAAVIDEKTEVAARG